MKTDLEVQQQLDHTEKLAQDHEYFDEVAKEFVDYVSNSIKDYRHIPEVKAAFEKWRSEFRDCFASNGDATIPELSLRDLFAEVSKQKALTTEL